MKVLLLGANGQLGTDVVRANRASPHPLELVPWTRREMDLSHADGIMGTLRAGPPFDVLINCTGFHAVDEVEGNAPQAFLINAFAVKALAIACHERGARFIHLSTDYVFGDGAAVPRQETDSPSPLNVYGASKLMGEALARHACRDTLVIRVASLFGQAGASGKGGNFVKTICKNAREKGRLRVVADQWMSPTYTWDVAHALLGLVQKHAPAGVYHVVNTGQASWYTFAEKIIKTAQIPAVVEPIAAAEYPRSALRPRYSALDNGKVVAIVGGLPAWEEALCRYLCEERLCET